MRERKRAREWGKTESKKERKLHRRCRPGCHIIIITITITLPEGFIYHQLQLIRLLLRLTTVDLYLDIDSFIHLLTSLLLWYVHLALFVHFDRWRCNQQNERERMQDNNRCSCRLYSIIRKQKKCVCVVPIVSWEKEIQTAQNTCHVCSSRNERCVTKPKKVSSKNLIPRMKQQQEQQHQHQP